MRISKALEQHWAWAWAWAHTGIVVYILYAKRCERAQLQKCEQREHLIPVLCMRWALIEMYLRSQTRLQTDRHARSYGSDMGTVPMGTDCDSAVNTGCPEPHSPCCSRRFRAPLERIFFPKILVDLIGVQKIPHSRATQKYQKHL